MGGAFRAAHLRLRKRGVDYVAMPDDMGVWIRIMKCNACNGTGKCMQCQGTGKIGENTCPQFNGSKKCKACGGSGQRK